MMQPCIDIRAFLCVWALEGNLSIDGELLAPPPVPKRKIEVYGDSVSAGEVSEALDFVGKEDPEHNGEYSNSWYSYAWMTARKLNARIHDIAQGGIALMDKTGWFHEPDAIGMEAIWDKLHYEPKLGESIPWDFSEYTPDAVIVAIGQNDSHPEDYMKEDIDCERSCLWRNKYRKFLEKSQPYGLTTGSAGGLDEPLRGIFRYRL